MHMKKRKFLIVVMLLITANLIFAQQEYTIIYNGGLDEVVVSVGDVLPDVIDEDSIVFSSSHFFKNPTEDPDVYRYLLHEKEFFAKDLKIIEDVENDLVMVYHLEICDDPSMLLADNIIEQDDRTLGDQRESAVDLDNNIPYYWWLLSGVSLGLFLFFCRRIGWL